MEISIGDCRIQSKTQLKANAKKITKNGSMTKLGKIKYKSCQKLPPEHWKHNKFHIKELSELGKILFCLSNLIICLDR